MRVRVRFNRNVLGRRAGTIDWVEATPIVERLVINKYLTWLDEPKDVVLPEVISAGFNDDLLPPVPDEAYGPDSVALAAWDDDGASVTDFIDADDESPWIDDLGQTYGV